MCNFFSFLSDGKGNIKYFNADQRLHGVFDENGYDCEYEYDSHTSIADHYFKQRAYEDTQNKWEYNPLTKKLVLDTQNAYDDRALFADDLARIDFSEMVPRIHEIAGFFEELHTVEFFKNQGEVPNPKMVRMYDTSYVARGHVYCDHSCYDPGEAFYTKTGIDSSELLWRSVEDFLNVNGFGVERYVVQACLCGYLYGRFFDEVLDIGDVQKRNLMEPFEIFLAGYGFAGYGDVTDDGSRIMCCYRKI